MRCWDRLVMSIRSWQRRPGRLSYRIGKREIWPVPMIKLFSKEQKTPSVADSSSWSQAQLRLPPKFCNFSWLFWDAIFVRDTARLRQRLQVSSLIREKGRLDMWAASAVQFNLSLSTFPKWTILQMARFQKARFAYEAPQSLKVTSRTTKTQRRLSMPTAGSILVT